MFVDEQLFRNVALFTRAWIEIVLHKKFVAIKMVALFTRAWIEILYSHCKHYRNESPSSRGRGLKFSALSTDGAELRSPSSRGRGLKYAVTAEKKTIICVALFTRAWIEIYIANQQLKQIIGRPLHEGVD